jgi:hypothetical protein
MNWPLLGLLAVWLGIAVAMALRDHFAMLREPDDGYVPRGRDSLRGCPHDWEVTRVNGFGLPCACFCRRCGQHRHKILDASIAGRETWREGKLPTP